MAATSVAGFSSCDSFLQEYSQDLAKVNSWEDLDEVLLGSAYLHTGKYFVANSYGQYDRDDSFDILHFMGDEIRMGDDLYMSHGYGKTIFPFFTWQKDTGISHLLRYEGGDDVYFNSPYKRINVCNMVISVIDDQPEHNPDDAIQKRRVKGEAYFLRAIYYFLLTNLYCDPYDPSTAGQTKGLPLKFSEVIEDKEYDRETLESTYKAILADLADAEKCLEGIERKSLYRADVNAVRLLQSRVYLYMQDWDNAISKAKEVLGFNDALLNLATKKAGDDCLYVSSPEILFSMGDYLIAFYFQDDKWDAAAFYISDDMLEKFKPNDYRTTRYIGTATYRSENVFRKVNGQKEANGSYTTVGSVFCFRTPEAYLTIAEASAYKGDETTAKEYLEKFLSTRMEGSVAVTQTGNDLIDLIRDERAREFLIEGHRWFDLRRYTVCHTYPWSKEIIHGYPYDDNNYYDHTNWYRLAKNDKAYTLPLPRSVRNFQISLGNAERPDRKEFDITYTHASSYDKIVEEE